MIKIIPLAVTCHPLLKSLNAVIDKNLSILCMDKEGRRVFTPRPMFSFVSAGKLSSYLFRAKLYPLERTVGSYQCKSKRCQDYEDKARKFERREHCMQRHLCEHFNLSGHSVFLNDLSVTLIDETDPKDPTKLEDYWIHTLKTKAPLGLNVEACLQSKLIVFCVTDYVYGRTVFGH